MTCGQDRMVRVWDAVSCALVKTFVGHTDLVVSAIFTPDSTKVITASFDMTMRVFDVATCSMLTMRSFPDRLYGCTLDHTGRQLAIGCANNVCYQFQLTGQYLPWVEMQARFLTVALGTRRRGRQHRGSPVLPPEVLLHIFTQFFDDNPFVLPAV